MASVFDTITSNALNPKKDPSVKVVTPTQTATALEVAGGSEPGIGGLLKNLNPMKYVAQLAGTMAGSEDVYSGIARNAKLPASSINTARHTVVAPAPVTKPTGALDVRAGEVAVRNPTVAPPPPAEVPRIAGARPFVAPAPAPADNAITRILRSLDAYFPPATAAAPAVPTALPTTTPSTFQRPAGEADNFGQLPNANTFTTSTPTIPGNAIQTEKLIQFQDGKDLQAAEGALDVNPTLNPVGDKGRFSDVRRERVQTALDTGNLQGDLRNLQYLPGNPEDYLDANGNVTKEGIAASKEYAANEMAAADKKEAALDAQRDANSGHWDVLGRKTRTWVPASGSERAALMNARNAPGEAAKERAAKTGDQSAKLESDMALTILGNEAKIEQLKLEGKIQEADTLAKENGALRRTWIDARARIGAARIGANAETASAGIHAKGGVDAATAGASAKLNAQLSDADILSSFDARVKADDEIIAAGGTPPNPVTRNFYEYKRQIRSQEAAPPSAPQIPIQSVKWNKK